VSDQVSIALWTCERSLLLTTFSSACIDLFVGATAMCVSVLPAERGVLSVCTRQVEQPKECRFSPYQNNGGTCLAIAGKDFCIVAADSRLSMGYSILSRTTPKVAQLTTKCCIASSGCQADMITLQKFLKFRMQVFIFFFSVSFVCLPDESG